MAPLPRDTAGRCLDMACSKSFTDVPPPPPSVSSCWVGGLGLTQFGSAVITRPPPDEDAMPGGAGGRQEDVVEEWHEDDAGLSTAFLWACRCRRVLLPCPVDGSSSSSSSSSELQQLLSSSCWASLRFCALFDATDSSFSTDVIFLRARILSPPASCNRPPHMGFIQEARVIRHTSK